MKAIGSFVLGLGIAALTLGAPAAQSIADEAQQGGAAETAPAETKSVEQLVSELGADDFAVREAATNALCAAGAEALPHLEKAAQSTDAEVRWRAQKALKAVKARSRAGSAATPGAKSGEPQVRRPSRGADPVNPLAELERELERMPGELGELFKGTDMAKLLPPEFGEAFGEIERALRQGQGQGSRPQVARDFWTFRFKDGKWVVERAGGADPLRDDVGVDTQPLSPLVRAQLQLNDGEGVAVERVRPGGIAARAGLEPYDIVLEVDGAPVAVADDLLSLNAAGEHKVTLLRGGERHTLTIAAATPTPAPTPKPEPGDEQKEDEEGTKEF